MENDVKTNSPRAWLLAARPKTLSAAAVPVMVGSALAAADLGADFQVLPCVLCFLFAFIMQIDANFINDYFDFRKGSDRTDRLGPERACAQGWITPRAMQGGIVVTTLLACVAGLPLLWIGGWELLLVGAVCVLFAFLYTLGLSYRGWGDVLVLVFFGWVPVCFTYYLQTGVWTWHPWSVPQPADWSLTHCSWSTLPRPRPGPHQRQAYRGGPLGGTCRQHRLLVAGLPLLRRLPVACGRRLSVGSNPAAVLPAPPHQDLAAHGQPPSGPCAQPGAGHDGTQHLPFRIAAHRRVAVAVPGIEDAGTSLSSSLSAGRVPWLSAGTSDGDAWACRDKAWRQLPPAWQASGRCL